MAHVVMLDKRYIQTFSAVAKSIAES
jgi:hypothetical protein